MEDTDEKAVPLLQEKTELQQHVLTEGLAMNVFACEFFEGLVAKGLFAVIALFFLESLHYDENTATELVHLFMFTSSFSSIVGAVISDGYILCGLTLLCTATLLDMNWRRPLSFAALFLSGIGGGGRPAFLTFGCDQVMWSVCRKAASNLESGESRADLMARSQGTASRQYFSSMYMFKKTGYAVGALLNPAIRVRSGGTFFYVFLLCACAKATGILIFWSGRQHYQFEKPDLDGDSDERDDLLKNDGQNSTDRNARSDLRKTQAVLRSWENMKSVISALLVLAPLIFFTALDLQVGSTWIFQARIMNCTISWLGNYTVPPDQMPVLTEILDVLVVPLVHMVIYPFVDKYVTRLTDLRKILGSFICVTGAFVMSGTLQIAIDTDRKKTSSGFSDVSIQWQFPQYVAMAMAVAMNVIARTDFAYHEAPKSMKTAVNAVIESFAGIGNGLIIVILLSLGPNASKVVTMYVFAGVGALGSVVMAFCSEMYVPRSMRKR
ncbi:hypothetical protein AXG93_2528s1740 [Marchantia polymorpha subsp. ruderalis]|uniref:Major facilitator superfamily (MFS) profile domain-containing protein n=1 Tax=Marchantia polymorpha subsp. ruderalis TaxID=1480154 RepID=A0A176WNS3_MARPO|nr:hypothetical protein AXG93_2528s1740 [Marchantia polymorpha subsp. ruderalis]